jgi:hypothetical protein
MRGAIHIFGFPEAARRARGHPGPFPEQTISAATSSSIMTERDPGSAHGPFRAHAPSGEPEIPESPASNHALG